MFCGFISALILCGSKIESQAGLILNIYSELFSEFNLI